MVREFSLILYNTVVVPYMYVYEVDNYKTEVCFTVVYAMLDFREIADSAQLGFTSSYTLSFSLSLLAKSV